MKTRTKAVIPVVALTAGKAIVQKLAGRKKESHRKRWIAAFVTGRDARHLSLSVQLR
jgi:hypothetical protein